MNGAYTKMNIFYRDFYGKRVYFVENEKIASEIKEVGHIANRGLLDRFSIIHFLDPVCWEIGHIK